MVGAVIGAGSALLQAPFGALADRICLARAMALAWALVLCATLSLWLWAGAPRQMLWPVGFVLGGVYTLVVIELGHRLTGAGLVKSMGLLVTAYTAGTAGGDVAVRAGGGGVGLAGVEGNPGVHSRSRWW